MKQLKDSDFMGEMQAATNLAPTKSSIMLLFSIVALLVYLVSWAGVAEIEELTRGSGQVVPTQEIQVVQSLEGGILAELLVKEGEMVEQGQTLIRIDDVQFASEERGTQARYLGLLAMKGRLEAEANGQEFKLSEEIKKKAPKVAANEIALHESRQRELENSYNILDDRIDKANADLSEVQAQINRLYQNRKLLQEEMEITAEMVRQRAVPKLEEIRLKRELTDINGQISANAERKKALEAEVQVALTEKSSQDDVFRSEALSQLSKVETELSELQERLTAAGDRVFRAELKSPVDGIVNSIALTTIGGVVEPAQRLVEIVPTDDELKIIAQVKPEDVAFLRPGMATKVKVTAYDPQKYGALDGTLTRLASNSVTDEEGNVFFEVEVRTEKNFMGSADAPLPITPGMVANIEVITGKRTILDYLLKPFLRARERAFTER